MNALRLIALSVSAYGFLAGPAFAQSAVSDQNASSISLSADEYAALLKCTLEKHPDETKRYAVYHLQRRDRQTPDENERDQDSRLMVRSLDGCFTLESGKQLPFSPDRLVNDWANANGIDRSTPPEVTDMQSLAECVAKHNPGFGHAYLHVVDMPSTNQSLRLRMVLQGLATPPCHAKNEFKIDQGALRKLLRSALDKNKAAN